MNSIMGYNIEFEGELVECVSKEMIGDTVERLTLADGRILEKANASAELECVGRTAEPRANEDDEEVDPDEVTPEELSDEELARSEDETLGEGVMTDEEFAASLEDEEIGESHEAADALEAEKDEANDADDTARVDEDPPADEDESRTDDIVWGEGPDVDEEPSGEDAKL